MGDPVTAGIALAAGSGVAKGVGARRAAKRQIQGVENAMGDITQGKNDALGRYDPYTQATEASVNPLMGMLGIGGQTDDYQNPLLEAIQGQAVRQTMNRNAATGRRGTGAEAGIIAEAMLQPAYQMQQNRLGQLMNLFGTGTNIANNQANIDMTAASNMANLQTQKGEAQAMKSGAPFAAASSMFDQMAGFAGMGGGQQTPTMNTGTGYTNGLPMSPSVPGLPTYKPTTNYSGAFSQFMGG